MADSRSDLNLDLYGKLYLIRRAEEKIIELYPENEMKTPLHLYLGGEAIAAGVCHALGQKNQVLCTYRSHGVYLANTMETDRFFGELYGKSTGMAKGRGGSMHISSPETGFLGSSAVVGSAISVAIGVAFANKYRGENTVVAVFFGDGAVEEGAFWESLNMACLWNLPVLFICEDNGFAVNTPVEQRHGYLSITEIVSKFNCIVLDTESTTDVEIIYQLAESGISFMRTHGKPVFIHAKYYRYRRHVGIEEDVESRYRTREEFEMWKSRDPIDLQRNKLLGLNISEDKIRSIERTIDDQIKRSIQLAKKAPFPTADDLYEGGSANV